MAKIRAEREAVENRYQANDERRRSEATSRAAAIAQRAVVTALSEALERLAAADLTHSIEAAFPPEYVKLKDDFGIAITKLCETMSTIATESRSMRSHSGEISRAADDLSQRTEQQAASLEETAAALDEITRHKLNDDLLALWERQRFTVVFVTHSVFESVYLSERIVVMAARPGRIVADLDVQAPYPRDELFRTSADYSRLCRMASETLKKAIAA